MNTKGMIWIELTVKGTLSINQQPGQAGVQIAWRGAQL